MLSTIRFSCALLSMLALAACGGGGADAEPTPPITSAPPIPVVGSPDPAPSAPPISGSPTPAPSAPQPPVATVVIPDAGNLKVTPSSATYATGSAELEAFDTLNALRLAAGAGVLTQSAAVDAAATAHANYLSANISGLDDFYGQDPTKSGFLGSTSGERLSKSGFAWATHSQLVANAGPSLKASECIRRLMSTVYHGAALLSSSTAFGVGVAQDAAKNPLCVLDLATASGDQLGQVPRASAVVAYPHSGQTSVASRLYSGAEVPSPSATLLPSKEAGHPIIVSLRNAAYLNYASSGTLSPSIFGFVLKDSRDKTVPVVMLAHPAIKAPGLELKADPLLPEGFVVLVPLEPLNSGENYTVHFSAALKLYGPIISKTWSFATAQGSSGSPGPGYGLGTFALDSVSELKRDSNGGSFFVVTVRNVGSGSITQPTLTCSGGRFFGGWSGISLEPNATLTASCDADASGDPKAARVVARGGFASNYDVVFGPFF